MRLYVDHKRCSGCRACQVACSLHLFRENNPKKAALIIAPHFPAPGAFEVQVCTQCGQCAEVCHDLHSPRRSLRLEVRSVRRMRRGLWNRRFVDRRVVQRGVDYALWLCRPHLAR